MIRIYPFPKGSKSNFLFNPRSVIIFLFLPLGLGLLLSCRTDIQTINQVTIDKNAPLETMKDVEIMYSDSGKVKMKLSGPQLDRFNKEKPYVEFPKGVNVLFYDDSMKVNSKLKADYGIRWEKEEKMEVKRNVEVVNIKDEKLNTEDLIWEEGKDKIYTDAFVKITTKDEVMYGDGLESNRDFTKYKIKNIKGTISLQDEKENK
ncbi:MAG: LPS export ABC transporter periplasmic protein LptC [Bacteroidetes bacterium]|nr:LPS export ABC transporter periplasmic protein LptC [Bacteroidota bacterium]